MINSYYPCPDADDLEKMHAMMLAPSRFGRPLQASAVELMKNYFGEAWNLFGMIRCNDVAPRPKGAKKHIVVSVHLSYKPQS